jgi:cytochrome c-type biogenesis protein CcmF
MAEFGESALISLIFISAFQIFIPLIFYKAIPETILRLAQTTQYFQFFLIILAFSTLIYSHVVTDLGIFNVAMNTHHEAPLLYKITGVWGNHEGSMLLWLCILIFYGSAVASVSSCPFSLKIKILSVQGLLSCAFTLFVFYTSNPFLKAPVFLSSGRDLNPILQDPALAFHPPTLYLGFVGFSIVYSFALASLLEKKPDFQWVQWVRPWALMAWSFLSLGITMGSWWAYYELGWGGWWFWDPVENASLMPWLVGTALIHALAVAQKRHLLVRWSYFLCILSFLLSLIGTFLVRSGSLSSVHAFASDPARGTFLLVILAGSFLLSMSILAVRFKKISIYKKLTPLISRENGILFNNHFLLTLAFTVLLGTLYPLLIEAITGESITVGAPYFKATFVPLSLPLLGLMGLSLWMTWGKGGTLQKISPHLWFPLVMTLGAGIGLLLFYHHHNWHSILMTAAGVWILVSTLGAFIQKRSQNPFSMLLAHGGLAIAILGMGIDTLGTQEKLVALRQGESIEFQGYKIELQSVQRHKFPNYEAERATISLKKKGRTSILFPEKRFYRAHQTLTTETALHHFWFSNLYFALGSLLTGDRWTLRVYYHPLVELIWLGGILLATGGFLGLIPRQIFRRKMRKKGLSLILFLFLGRVFPAEAVEIGERLLNPVLEQRARILSSEIKCPVCAGQSIEDSQAPLARKLRRSIRESLLENKTDEEIRQKLIHLYGENVLFKPVFDFKNSLLWILPFLIGLGSVGLTLWRVCKKE